MKKNYPHYVLYICSTKSTYLEDTVPPVVSALRVLGIINIIVSDNEGVAEIMDVVLLANADQTVAEEKISILVTKE